MLEVEQRYVKSRNAFRGITSNQRVKLRWHLKMYLSSQSLYEFLLTRKDKCKLYRKMNIPLKWERKSCYIFTS
jgi:hypothetical protein